MLTIAVPSSLEHDSATVAPNAETKSCGDAVDDRARRLLRQHPGKGERRESGFGDAYVDVIPTVNVPQHAAKWRVAIHQPVVEPGQERVVRFATPSTRSAV
jgi:hypothetical protein